MLDRITRRRLSGGGGQQVYMEERFFVFFLLSRGCGQVKERKPTESTTADGVGMNTGEEEEDEEEEEEKERKKKKESGPVAELGTGSPVISVDERSSPRRYPLVLPSHCCVSFFLPFFAYLFFSLSLSSKKKQNKKKSQRRRRKRTGIWRLRFTSRPRALGCCLQTVNCLDYRQERERERFVSTCVRINIPTGS